MDVAAAARALLRCALSLLFGHAHPGGRDVAFESMDGLVLDATWVPNESRRWAAVLAPGRSGSKSSPYLVEAASIYARAGFSVLMLSLRSQGNSEGRFVTAGYQEVRDVRGAVRWLEGQGFDPKHIILHGWSTGGVAVLRAAPSLHVGAVVEESAWAELLLLFESLLPGVGRFPANLLGGAASLAGRLLGVEFDPWSLKPREEAALLHRRGIPLFIIHSSSDRKVPFEHARLLACAHPGAVLWQLEGYKHTAAYTHPDYEKRLLEFLAKATIDESTD